MTALLLLATTVALAGPKSSLTGHTLCDARSPIVYETIRFPECQPGVRKTVAGICWADPERLLCHQAATSCLKGERSDNSSIYSYIPAVS